jgi:hypothetical protein
MLAVNEKLLEEFVPLENLKPVGSNDIIEVLYPVIITSLSSILERFPGKIVELALISESPASPVWFVISVPLA